MGRRYTYYPVSFQDAVALIRTGESIFIDVEGKHLVSAKESVDKSFSEIVNGSYYQKVDDTKGYGILCDVKADEECACNNCGNLIESQLIEVEKIRFCPYCGIRLFDVDESDYPYRSVKTE